MGCALLATLKGEAGALLLADRPQPLIEFLAPTPRDNAADATAAAPLATTGNPLPAPGGVGCGGRCRGRGCNSRRRWVHGAAADGRRQVYGNTGMCRPHVGLRGQWRGPQTCTVGWGDSRGAATVWRLRTGRLACAAGALDTDLR